MKNTKDRIREEVTSIFQDYSNDEENIEAAVNESMNALSFVRQDILFRTLTVIYHEL